MYKIEMKFKDGCCSLEILSEEQKNVFVNSMNNNSQFIHFMCEDKKMISHNKSNIKEIDISEVKDNEQD